MEHLVVMANVALLEKIGNVKVSDIVLHFDYNSTLIEKKIREILHVWHIAVKPEQSNRNDLFA